MSKPDKQLAALLSLLQDDDPRVASLAMEQVLKLGNVAEQTIAELQEDGNQQLRHRIHQLSSILARRRTRQEFVAAVHADALSLWEGVCKINELYDPQCNLDAIRKQIRELAAELPAGTIGASRIAALMKKRDYLVPEEDTLDSELYMMDSALETKYGSAPALCVVAMQVGSLRRWKAEAVLYEGRMCLLEENDVLVDPAANWKVRNLESSEKLHRCSKRDVWYIFLAQLFLVALVDGQLRDLYHFGDLLTALNQGSVDELPYPLGETGVRIGGEVDR